MRKALVIIIFVIIAVLAYSQRDKINIEQAGMSQSNQGGTFRPDPSGATFTFDDGPITLSGGRNERDAAPDGIVTEETILLDKFAYGDINADGKEDTVLLLARYGGGSGIFIYLAAFVSGPVTYRGSGSTFLGDRISPQSISINESFVTVQYLDRGAGEAMAMEPTIPVSEQFVYRNGAFQRR